jgi:hypothetical protein
MLFGFAAALTALFPSGSTRSASFYSTVENLIVLSLVGEPPGIDLPDGSDTIYPTVLMAELQKGFPLSQAMYYVLYCSFLVLVLVLLLNLLIAMMSDTYYKTMATATMHWRIKFARLVLRLELLASHTPTALLCRDWPLAKALRDPQYWPWWLSFGAGARCAQSYKLPHGQGSFVFRTYDEVPHQSLIMIGQRTDPFRRHTERLREKGKKEGGGTGGGGAAPPTASEAALTRQMELVHTKLDDLLKAGGASAPLPAGPPAGVPAAAPSLNSSPRSQTSMPSLSRIASNGIIEASSKRKAEALLLSASTAPLPPIINPPTKPVQLQEVARGRGSRCGVTTPVAAEGNGSYVMASRRKKPEQ